MCIRDRWQTADPIGYLDGWNNFAYCRNQVVNHIDYLGAWGANVHYDLTYDAAVKAGFPKDVAEKIAQANIDTDSLFGGEGPWGAGTGDSSRHFDYNSDPTVDSRETHAQQEMAKGQHYWNTYQNEKAYEAWGRALQDVYKRQKLTCAKFQMPLMPPATIASATSCASPV